MAHLVEGVGEGVDGGGEGLAARVEGVSGRCGRDAVAEVWQRPQHVAQQHAVAQRHRHPATCTEHEFH
jgi:hypothetical protein